jgi:hypothetical protein
MFCSTTLSRWFELAAGDAIVKDPGDIHAEANANLWTFSPGDEESDPITSEALQGFVLAILDERQQWAKRHAVHGMTFYCWHDFQLRAIRFSLVSSSYGRLPFGCRTRTADDLLTITRQSVERDWNNAEYFHDDMADAAGLDDEYVLDVWVRALA